MKTKIKTLFPLTDPYRLFFLLGLIAFFMGILLWSLFQFKLISFYPRFEHGDLMFMAALWCFIAGFLMTAIPKMTNTFSVKIIELIIALGLVFFQAVAIFTQLREASGVIYFLQILFLVNFVFRRIWVRKVVPFEGFYFIPFAFFSALVGSLFLAFSYQINLVYLFIGKAFVLNLILGIGSRLIPAISKTAQALMPDVQTQKNKKLQYLIYALGLNFGFYTEAFLSKEIGMIIQFIYVILISVTHLKLFQRMTTFTILGLGLKISLVLLWLYYCLNIFGINHLAATHFLYIGVILLITIMVATRVMVAHGGQSLNYEIHSERLWLVLSLIVIATFLRFFSGNDIMGYLLTAAVYSLLLAIVLWSYKFCKILKDKIKN